MRSRIYYALASAVGIAGALHLYLASTLLTHQFLQFAEFFLIAGTLQAVWTVPLLKGRGRVWLYGGLGGNVALFFLWLVTRFPNPITRMGLPVNSIGIVTEALQLAFIALAVAAFYTLHKQAAAEQSPEGHTRA
ncbi:MAG: hypothetical protein KGI33_03340 [Thaumarchaeota archaeon]|nr:hypothetical protein [Nitrososphaerota archaeon]